MKKYLFSVSIACLIVLSSNAQDKKLYTAQDVKDQFIRTWQAYKMYAWGHDVLLPVTKAHADWYKESLHISPIDAYSTMRVMKLDKYAKEVEQYIKDSVSFDKDI